MTGIELDMIGIGQGPGLGLAGMCKGRADRSVWSVQPELKALMTRTFKKMEKSRFMYYPLKMLEIHCTYIFSYQRKRNDISESEEVCPPTWLG